jgi:hypothetical protein
MTDLKVQLSVQVPNGPIFQSTRTVAVNAYETFNVSIPPNEKGDAAAGVDRMATSEEGPVKLLLIQSNIYPVGKEAGEIILTIESTSITDKPLHEPVFHLGAKVIEAIGKIEKISFENTYKLENALKNEADAVQKEVDAKDALKTKKDEEEAAKKAVEAATEAGAKAEAEEKLKKATAAVTEAEKALTAATTEVTKAIANLEQEKADHTAQLAIVIGRDAPAP